MLRACLKKHSRKLHNIIFLFPQRQHRINTSLRLHSHILIQLDLFSALTADAIINIHQCSQFHIVTYTVLRQRIEFLCPGTRTEDAEQYCSLFR